MDDLKLILQKLDDLKSDINKNISNINLEINQINYEINQINQKLDSKSDKTDIMRIENTLGEKVKALFDDREVKNDSLNRIEDKIDTIHQELNTIEKVTIKNSADIIDLQSYRKEN